MADYWRLGLGPRLQEAPVLGEVCRWVQVLGAAGRGVVNAPHLTLPFLCLAAPPGLPLPNPHSWLPHLSPLHSQALQEGARQSGHSFPGETALGVGR